MDIVLEERSTSIAVMLANCPFGCKSADDCETCRCHGECLESKKKAAA